MPPLGLQFQFRQLSPQQRLQLRVAEAQVHQLQPLAVLAFERYRQSHLPLPLVQQLFLRRSAVAAAGQLREGGVRWAVENPGLPHGQAGPPRRQLLQGWRPGGAAQPQAAAGQPVEPEPPRERFRQGSRLGVWQGWGRSGHLVGLLRRMRSRMIACIPAAGASEADTLRRPAGAPGG